MPPRDPPLVQARRWLARAKGNLSRAAKGKDPSEFWEDFCYDAQQAAEKSLKAVLVAREVRVPRTHDLAELLSLLQRQGLTLPREAGAIAALTRFAVEMRYPGVMEAVTQPQWEEAVRAASLAVSWAESEISRHAN